MKKALMILLALLLLCSVFPAFAEDVVTDSSAGTGTGLVIYTDDFQYSALKVDGGYDLTGDNAYTAKVGGATFTYDKTAQVMTITGGSVTLTTEGTSSDRVVVAGNGVVLKLNNVTITSLSGSPIAIDKAASCSIYLEGVNILNAPKDFAGLEVGYKAVIQQINGFKEVISREFGSVEIFGPGQLDANGGNGAAGIGGSKQDVYYGDITIQSGIINAKCTGSSGAGIGSSGNNQGSSGSYKVPTIGNPAWGTITINGGIVTATGGGDAGAGIGGGNHIDSGAIIINGGQITASGGAAGIGCGNGSHKVKSGEKGPGSYYATVTINDLFGTTDVTAIGGWNAAGIGGGYCCDADITITGGKIKATGGTPNPDALWHQGGAGIGGGYEGHAIVTITGGNITANGTSAGAGIGSGPAPNDNSTRGEKARGPLAYTKETIVNISGNPEINATAGEYGAAGIGGGTGADKVTVIISGGNISAKGAGIGDNSTLGGAGIGGAADFGCVNTGNGSGLIKVKEKSITSAEQGKYFAHTQISVTITGGTIKAIGGWGASAIGSGADGQAANGTTENVKAEQISITGGKVQAYADGTKFAIDTKEGSGTNTKSYTQGRTIRNVIQGTFINQDATFEKGAGNPLNVSVSGVGSYTLPKNYRSFAVSAAPGTHQITVSGELYGASVDEDHIKNGSDDTQLFTDSGPDFVVPGNGFSDNFYLNPVTTVTLTKQWEDGDNAAGARPEKITAKLIKNGGASMDVELSAANGWKADVSGLIKYKDEKTAPNAYTVDEIRVPGYTTKVEGTTIINTIDSIDVSGVKTWVDDNNRDGVRPGSITVNLLADGVQVASQTVTGTDNAWSYTFKDVPKAKDGKNIVYTVSEAAVPGYTAAYNGMNITNTHTPEVITVSGAKTWVDDNNRDGLRPDSITVSLLADGAQVDTATVTAAGGWSWSFADKPRYAQGAVGREIVYTVSEAPVSGYTAAVTGYNITNTHEPARISVSGTKVWDDNNDSDGLRPASITVNLLADGRQVDSRAVTGTGNSWSFTFEDLYRYANGREITYTVTEEAVANYTASVSGTTITNTHTPETVTVSGNKIWDDQDDKDGLRPASVTVNLLADGVRKDSKTVSAGDGWSFSFTDLPKYSHGREIQYTVSENAPAGYTAGVSGYNITNTHTPEKITVSGVKTWVDHDNKDGLRPASVTINLLADGVQKDSRTVSGTGDTWSYSFTDLPKYADGKEIVYSVTEDAVPEYETNVMGFNVFNVHNPKGEDTKLYKLTVRYWADGKKVFPDVNATYKYGDKYNVTSPTLPGYTVDLAVVDGVIYQDTVRDVYYTPADVHLTIYYQYLDGTTAADTYYNTLHGGDGYSVVSPIIENYIVDRALVDGVMPGHDVEIVVYYTPAGILVVEKVPVEKREKDKSYLIDDYGTPLGLGSVELNAGETFD